MHPFVLDRKNALVTGGGRGLGLEIARVLVAKGASVAIVAREEAEIERALADLSEWPHGLSRRVSGHACDLRDGEATDAMLDDLDAHFGPIDVLVNNAGTIQVGPLDSMTVDDFEEAMQLHCFAPLRLTLALRDGMRERGGGRIANIASIGGIVPVPHLLPYSASKFALMGLSQGMHAELAREGIVVSTIAPGLMRTGSPRRALFKGDPAQEYAWFSASDSLPLFSMDSGRAARRIVRAIENGEARVVLGAPAKLAAAAVGLLPGLVAGVMTLANGLLPRGGDGLGRPGFRGEAAPVPSLAAMLSERGATRNGDR